MRSFYVLTRPQRVFAVCAAIFLTALVIAEATAGKFFTAFHLPFTLNLLGVEFDRVIMTAGVIAFPITFIVTDVMNEYFGKRGIRFVTMLGVAMVVFEFILIQAALAVPTDPISPVPDEAFASVFGTTTRVIFGSLIAFTVGSSPTSACSTGSANSRPESTSGSARQAPRSARSSSTHSLCLR